ncbi:hypothetical protein EVAR_70595_1 [Eumeta japonica]|uniref:Uncharacterized protein n=1 Tax=Eumeta variegata TaxID=151549 RepID=A0A4C2ADH7_EUMVA|nr:hypothetical protein EVAR_70595_1 [Eumeta japonica]
MRLRGIVSTTRHNCLSKAAGVTSVLRTALTCARGRRRHLPPEPPTCARAACLQLMNTYATGCVMRYNYDLLKTVTNKKITRMPVKGEPACATGDTRRACASTVATDLISIHTVIRVSLLNTSHSPHGDPMCCDTTCRSELFKRTLTCGECVKSAGGKRSGRRHCSRGDPVPPPPPPPPPPRGQRPGGRSDLAVR